jgi:hypothetical protein
VCYKYGQKHSFGKLDRQFKHATSGTLILECCYSEKPTKMSTQTHVTQPFVILSRNLGFVSRRHEIVDTSRRCPFFEKYFFENFENFKSVFRKIYYTICTFLPIAAPRLRPLFKDKQIVEGSDGCGLFVDNLIFFKDCIVLLFFTVFRLVYAVLTFGS